MSEAPAGWRWSERGWLEREADQRRISADLWTERPGDPGMTALSVSALDVARLAALVDSLWPVAASDREAWLAAERAKLEDDIAEFTGFMERAQATADRRRAEIADMRARLAALGEGT